MSEKMSWEGSPATKRSDAGESTISSSNTAVLGLSHQRPDMRDNMMERGIE